MSPAESITAVLARKLQRKALAEAYILGVAQQVIGDRGRAISIRQGTLKVQTHDPGVGFELTTSQVAIVQQINQQLNQPTIRRLRVVVSLA